MTEKEKQIQEMKQVLVDYAMKHDITFSFEAYRRNCEVLYNAGYRKVNFKDHSPYEMASDDTVLKAYQEGVNDGVAIAEAEARKETAKEIAEKVKAKAQEQIDFLEKENVPQREINIVAINGVLRMLDEVVKEILEE